MKTKSYGDLFDEYIQSKKIYESVVLIEKGTGETIFSKAYGEKEAHLHFIILTKSYFLLGILIK